MGRKILARVSQLLALFCMVLMLSGCVQYDVGLHWQTQQQGAIVQTIKLSKPLTTLNEGDSEEILDSVATKVKLLGGKIKKVSNQELRLTIPFSNNQDLVSKFNQFFTPSFESSSLDAIDLLQLNAQIRLDESNLLLLERNHLQITVDLRSLGMFSDQGDLIVSSGSLIDLAFNLQTPWGAKSIVIDDSLAPEILANGRQLVWHLKPGKINEIAAIYWLPNSLGIGTFLIIVLMIAGFYLKYRRFPWAEVKS